MQNQDLLLPLRSAFLSFRDLILALSEPEFLSPMDDWSPRDVVAHLVGWNWHMIEAASSILAGETPAYYAGASTDYRDMNAAFVQRHASRSKSELLSDLDASLNDFEAFLLSLPPDELDADHGVVHYRGHPATIAGIVNSLAGDYRHHTRQIGERPRSAFEPPEATK